jgi:hypothetical protein
MKNIRNPENCGGFVEQISKCNSVTKIIPVTIMTLVAPEAGTMHELLFKERPLFALLRTFKYSGSKSALPVF